MNTTDNSTPPTGAPTLDAERIDRFRTYLVVEAAADLAHARNNQTKRANTTVRRLAIGGLAVAMLVGAMVAFDSGTGSKATRADAAISITREDGWTTIELNDPEATAAQVLSELKAAGISAQLAPPGADAEGDTMDYGDGDVISLGTQAAEPYAMGESVASGTLIQIDIVFDHLEGVAVPDGDPWADASYSEAIGVRMDRDKQTLSIRNGGDHRLILLPAR